nr:hypothetical protein [Gammaproteobacteria bacterium]
TADDINNFSVESDSSDSKQSDMQIDFEDELSLDTSLETKEEAELVTESLDLSDVADPEPEHREVSEDVSSSVQLKLDLATSFVSISNNDRARELLEDVVKDGSDEQVAKAKSLLSQLN